MAMNTLGSLNDYLFEQLERLNEVDGSDRDAVDAEIGRSRAVCGVAAAITENAKVILKSAELRADAMGKSIEVPKLLGGE